MFALLLACSEPSMVSPPPPGALAAAAPEEAALSAPLAAVRARPDDAEAWSALALAMLDRRRESGSEIYVQYAEDAAEAALARDPADLLARQVQIRARFDRHRFREAAELARAEVARSPEDVTMLLLLGDALLELGAYDEALDTLQRALDLRPDLRTYERGAWLRYLYGDLDGAIALAVEAIRAGGRALPEPTAFCFVDLATFQLAAGRPEVALEATDAALQLVPDYPLARSVQGRALAMLGRDREAIDVLTARVERQPLPADLLLLAELLEGDPGAAPRIAQAEELSSVDPRAIAHFLARHAQDPARALTLAETAVRDRPTVENLDTASLAYLRAGRVADALAASDRATALGTADPHLQLHRGLIALAAGDRAAAEASLKAADAAHPRVDPLLRAELAAALGE